MEGGHTEVPIKKGALGIHNEGEDGTKFGDVASSAAGFVFGPQFEETNHVGIEVHFHVLDRVTQLQ